MTTTERPPCPRCHSTHVHRRSLLVLANGTARQRWACQECGRAYCEPPKPHPWVVLAERMEREGNLPG